MAQDGNSNYRAMVENQIFDGNAVRVRAAGLTRRHMCPAINVADTPRQSHLNADLKTDPGWTGRSRHFQPRINADERRFSAVAMTLSGLSRRQAGPCAPAVTDEDSEVGSHYIAAMKIADRYSYAGRKWVFERVRPVIGGSIGHDAVALKGVDSTKARASLYSTEHEAGRLFGRKQALESPQATIASEKPFIVISACKCLSCASRSAEHHWRRAPRYMATWADAPTSRTSGRQIVVGSIFRRNVTISSQKVVRVVSGLERSEASIVCWPIHLPHALDVAAAGRCVLGQQEGESIRPGSVRF